MTSTAISIVSLRNEGFPTFCLSLTTARHLGFTVKLRNSPSRRMFANSSWPSTSCTGVCLAITMWGNAATAFSLSSQFHVCGRTCLNYIAESVASWEKENGSVAKLWASNIRFGYCAILTVTLKRAKQLISVCMSLLSAMRLSIIRIFTLHQTGYSIHHVRSND